MTDHEGSNNLQSILNEPQRSHPIYVISGGVGTSGEQVVRTVLAQFQDVKAPLKIISHVRTPEKIEQVVSEAAGSGGTIVHTMVNAALRQELITLAKAKGVPAVDLVGSLIEHLSSALEQDPIGTPGLYRQLHLSYFKRIEALEFTLAHDDGKNSQNWSEADIVLVGVSRVGKTPLSIYLSMLGWKVANVPLVIGIEPRPELFAVDPNRVVGLTIDPGQLVYHREHRQNRLGLPNAGKSSYVDPTSLYEEVKAARKIFRKGGFPVIDVTDKPIETSADEILTKVTRRLGRDL